MCDDLFAVCARLRVNTCQHVWDSTSGIVSLSSAPRCLVVLAVLCWSQAEELAAGLRDAASSGLIAAIGEKDELTAQLRCMVRGKPYGLTRCDVEHWHFLRCGRLDAGRFYPEPRHGQANEITQAVRIQIPNDLVGRRAAGGH
eukprot:6201324-Pleurochrysis_carterae.AAC.2